jgi:hypothetical protein
MPITRRPLFRAAFRFHFLVTLPRFWLTRKKARDWFCVCFVLLGWRAKNLTASAAISMKVRPRPTTGDLLASGGRERAGLSGGGPDRTGSCQASGIQGFQVKMQGQAAAAPPPAALVASAALRKVAAASTSA